MEQPVFFDADGTFLPRGVMTQESMILSMKMIKSFFVMICPGWEASGYKGCLLIHLSSR